jgi:hypothetical protein
MGGALGFSIMEDAPQTLPQADAVHYMAIKTAEGTGVPQNWDVALDHLQRSAELGSRLAQAELAGLSGEWAVADDILAGEAVPESRWSQLRSSIDVTEWLEPPCRPVFSEVPGMATVDDVAAPEMCNWLIARARPRVTPAQMYDRTTGEYFSSSSRTNSAYPLRGPDSDLIVRSCGPASPAQPECGCRRWKVPPSCITRGGRNFGPISTFFSIRRRPITRRNSRQGSSVR